LRWLIYLLIIWAALMTPVAMAGDLPHPHLPIRYRTKHFRMETDISMEFLKEMGPFLEAAHREIMKLPGMKPRSDRHDIEGIWVFFSKDQERFTAYTKSEGSFIIPSRASGRAYIRCVPEMLYETRRRVLHELCHTYMWACGISAESGNRELKAVEQRMCDVVSWHYWDGKNLKLCYAPNAPAFQIKWVAAMNPELITGEAIKPMGPYQGAKLTVGEVTASIHFFLTDKLGRLAFNKYGKYRRGGKTSAQAMKLMVGKHSKKLNEAATKHTKKMQEVAQWVMDNPIEEKKYTEHKAERKVQRDRRKLYKKCFFYID